MQNLNISDWFSRISLLLLAICLQVQITLFASEDYLGLRVNSADFLLPICGLFIAGSLLFRKSFWPRWQTPFGYWAPALLSVVIVLGIANGYRLQGEFSSWAFLNKGVGWCVLMAYLALTAWIATNNPQTIRNWFVKPFLIFLCTTLICEISLRLLFSYEILQPFTLLDAFKEQELSGFMANRNAFAFLYLSALAVGSIYLIKGTDINKTELVCFKLLWALLPLFFIMNASRTTLLVIIPLLMFVVFCNWRIFIKKLLPLMLIGTLFTPLLQTHKLAWVVNNYKNVSMGYQSLTVADQADAETISDNMYKGDQLRIQVIKDSLHLLKQNPITGTGIGSVYKYQQDQGDREFTAIIDNTPLWVLAEMGPFGFLAFGGVFFSMLFALHRKSEGMDDFNKVFAHSVIFVMIGFGLFSLFHEILYSRFLWVFLGLALAVPITKARQD